MIAFEKRPRTHSSDKDGGMRGKAHNEVSARKSHCGAINLTDNARFFKGIPRRIDDFQAPRLAYVGVFKDRCSWQNWLEGGGGDRRHTWTPDIGSPLKVFCLASTSRRFLLRKNQPSIQEKMLRGEEGKSPLVSSAFNPWENVEGEKKEFQ